MSVVLERTRTSWPTCVPLIEEPPEEKPEPRHVQVLRQVREFLSDRSRWCNNAGARNAEGDWVNTFDKEAVQFCAAGATLKMVGYDGSINGAWREPYNEAMKLWAESLALYGKAPDDPGQRVVHWNDHYGYDAVMGGLDKALAKYEAGTA